MKALKEKRPAVTISRETGAGAITIGQMVTDSFQALEKGRLHSWALFDQNIVKAVLEDQSLPERLEEFIKEEAKPAVKDEEHEIFVVYEAEARFDLRNTATADVEAGKLEFVASLD